MSIYEDRSGNIWFGTDGEASRYDPRQAAGNSFRNFTAKDRLPGNDISPILEEKQGNYGFIMGGELCFYV